MVVGEYNFNFLLVLDCQRVALRKCGTVFYHLPDTRYHMGLGVGERLCSGLKCEMPSLNWGDGEALNLVFKEWPVRYLDYLKAGWNFAKNNIVALKLVAMLKLIHLSWWIWMISVSQMNAWGISGDIVLIASVLIVWHMCVQILLSCFPLYWCCNYVPAGLTMHVLNNILWQRWSFLIIIIDTFYECLGFMTFSCLWQTVAHGWTAWFDFTGDCVNTVYWAP